MWHFVFEDDKKIVGLRTSGNWGPWASADDAMVALAEEFGASDPALLCYELVKTEIY